MVGKTLEINSAGEVDAEIFSYPTDENIEIPEEVENAISILLDGLQDKVLLLLTPSIVYALHLTF